MEGLESALAEVAMTWQGGLCCRLHRKKKTPFLLSVHLLCLLVLGDGFPAGSQLPVEKVPYLPT
jgi:hypothetical protein